MSQGILTRLTKSVEAVAALPEAAGTGPKFKAPWQFHSKFEGVTLAFSYMYVLMAANPSGNFLKIMEDTEDARRAVEIESKGLLLVVGQ